MKIAAAQILSGADPQDNLEIVADYAAQAAAAGARMVVFPEATMRAFGTGPLIDIAEPIDGAWATAVADIARAQDIVIMAGMFHPADDGSRVHNSYLVTGISRGETEHDIHSAYHKIHLYDAFGFQESNTVAGGSRTLIVPIDDVAVGVSVCYDIRFPGQFRKLARDGAQLIICGASWGQGPGKVEQWELLARARALDSTTPLVAVGQADPESVGRKPHSSAPQGVGHSMVIGADGEVLAAAEAKPQLLVHDLDITATEKVREAIPVLSGGKVTE